MPLRHKDIKRRSNVTTSKGLAAIASGLEPIAKQLVSIYGADQTLRANVVEKECLWIEASEIEAINTKTHCFLLIATIAPNTSIPVAIL